MNNNFVAMDLCYYCCEGKDILLDRRFKDISHLHKKVVNMEPCSKCKEYMKNSVIVVSVRDGESQEGNPPNPYRTGGWWVITLDAARRLGIDTNKNRFVFIEDSIAKQIGLEKPEPNQTET